MKTVAICNHKGGSGKTTSSFYLGLLLAKLGLRTLLIDLDPQANLSSRFDYEPGPTVADALGGAMEARVLLAETVVPVANSGLLFLAPSEMQLANTAVGLLNDAVRGRTALRRALSTTRDGFDLCLVDCPPEAGILLVNALLAADGVLCTAEPEADAIAGIRQVVEIVAHIRQEFERETPVMLGTIATQVDQRTNLHRDGMEIMARSRLAPLLATIPARKGDERDMLLMAAYGVVASYLADWAAGKEGP